MERRKNMTQWERNAVEARDTYGAHVDWEERFYECLECGEPIYECDWTEDELVNVLCPVCGDGEDWEDENEDWEDDVDETGFDPYMGDYSYDC